jgi:hypothetical protein
MNCSTRAAVRGSVHVHIDLSELDVPTDGRALTADEQKRTVQAVSHGLVSALYGDDAADVAVPTMTAAARRQAKVERDSRRDEWRRLGEYLVSIAARSASLAERIATPVAHCRWGRALDTLAALPSSLSPPPVGVC